MSYRSISRADPRARQSLTGGRASTSGKSPFAPVSPTQSAGSLHQQRLREVFRIRDENERQSRNPSLRPSVPTGGE